MQNDLQLSDITLESHQSSDQISSRIDYTSIQQNTSAVHWSFLNDCEINRVITHLSGIKLNDLKVLYDTVSLKMTKQNGQICKRFTHVFNICWQPRFRLKESILLDFDEKTF